MLDKWDYSGASTMCFSDHNQESYKKSAQFLGGGQVEDWGCGTCWSKKYFTDYRGIDGSYHPCVDEIVDLVSYTSNVDNILIRQTLSCNKGWAKILENAKLSFKKKLCLVIYTPFAPTTKEGYVHTVRDASGVLSKQLTITEMYFNPQDILDFFPESEYIVTHEEVQTTQLYNRDWIIYVEKINK